MIRRRDGTETKKILLVPAQNSFFCPIIIERLFGRGEDEKEAVGQDGCHVAQ